MPAVKSCVFRLLAMLVFVSCAIKCDNRFGKIREYMNRYYTQGYHSQWLFTSYSHDVFLKDFESNRLFKDFRHALNFGNEDEKAQAKKVHESILIDLKKCLQSEIDHKEKVMRRYKMAEPLLNLNSAAILASWFYFKYTKGIGFWEMFCRVYPIRDTDLGSYTTAETALSYYVGIGRVCQTIALFGEFMDAKTLELSIKDLEQRIETWSHMLPQENNKEQ